MFRRLFSFLSEVKKELFVRTNWPSRDDVLNTTSTVVFSLIVVSLFLFFVDYLASTAVQYLVVDEVAYYRGIIQWFLYPIFGLPWRFLALVTIVGFIMWLINRIKKNLVG